MKIKMILRFKWLIIILCLIISISVISGVLIWKIKSGDKCDYDPDSACIVIESDADFIKHGFKGSGQIDDPYLINNLTIISKCLDGISIRWTKMYFIIQNCYFNTWSDAIKLDYAASGTAIIKDNIFEGYGSGVSIKRSDNSKVINNRFNKGSWGLYIDESDYCTIKNNYFYNFIHHSILIYKSSSTLIEDNFIEDSQSGIEFIFAPNSTILNNQFFNSGIYFGYENPLNFETYSIINNTVNNLEIAYINNLSNITIKDKNFGQLIISNSNNMTITDLVFSNASVGLILYYCNYSQISNIISSFNLRLGMSLWNCLNCSITSNNCSYNQGDGIGVFYSESIELKNNVLVSNKRVGIATDSTFFSSISNNSCVLNGAGICLFNTKYSTIYFNLIQQNIGVGIFMGEWSYSNIIHHNSFFLNYLENSNGQAVDNGRNIWYEEKSNEGNFWSDLNGRETYPIQGWGDNIDLYPLLIPPVNPFNILNFKEEETEETFILISSFIFTISIITIYQLQRKKKKI